MRVGNRFAAAMTEYSFKSKMLFWEFAPKWLHLLIFLLYFITFSVSGLVWSYHMLIAIQSFSYSLVAPITSLAFGAPATEKLRASIRGFEGNRVT